MSGPNYYDYAGALRAMKAGMKVRRSGWNGKNMWVALTPGTVITPEEARTGAAKHLAQEVLARAPVLGQEAKIVINPHFDMRAADGSLVIGWLASQTDMVAEDWEILG